MLLELKGFQDAAVADVLKQCGFASAEVMTGNPQAVVLSAPTGSGKTVVATAVLEALKEGYEGLEGDEEATFLWLSDLPELNEQSKRKVDEVSSVFGPDSLVTIEHSFDQEYFDPGTIYFLNTQKLREGALLTMQGDRRNFTIWETIANTVESRRGSFWVVIDEAHKGMGVSAADRARTQTIIRKFIEGSDEIPPVPLALGISATPQRFRDLIQDTPRMERLIAVKPEDVRESGLLKDSITLFHPTESQPADVTLLKQAAESLLEYEQQWELYNNQRQDGDPVRPILVVQVEDRSSANEISKTDIEDALQALEEVLGPLESEQVAHSFQESTAIEVGSRTLRYCAPPDIQSDPDLRVVFFKTSLNTGWDCPRAEVMMSFRKAADYTLIAQLVGRMVRTPLARRVETEDFLNSVCLYLPHYDAEGLNRILDYLQNPDPGELPQIEVKKGEDLVSLHRNAALGDCFEAAESIATYIVSSVRKASDVRRLMKLARRLANDDIVPTAIEDARDLILTALQAAYEDLKDTEQFKALVKEHGTIDLRAVDYQYGLGESDVAELQVPVTPENVDDLFDAAGRKIGDGIHKLYWKDRVANGSPSERMLRKLETFALIGNRDVIIRLEEISKAKLQEWFDQYWGSAINKLSGDRKESYHQIRQTAKDPEEVTLTLRETLQGKKAESKWSNHLYVDDEGMFPYDFSQSSWERRVIEAEQARDDYVGFLRNEPRKDWSLTIPYKKSGTIRPQYPDLIVFRRDGDNVIVDLLDPHNPSLSDWWQKAVGLADYAAKHGQDFGRIELIYIETEDIRRLDLTDETTRNKVRAVTSNDHLQQLFSQD
jgi:type III restriction enzyme